MGRGVGLSWSIINPLIPQSWGLFKAGGHPQTPDRKYPAPLFTGSSAKSGYDFLAECVDCITKRVTGVSMNPCHR
jgi:hypothetical protein